MRLLKPALIGTVAVGLYVALIAWFHFADFYDTHFFDSGWIVARYNLLRAVFIGVLAWLVYAPGAGLLTLIAGKAGLADLPIAERYAIGFFTGSALWHVTMFCIGLAGGDNRIVAVTLTTLVLGLSAPHLTNCLDEAWHRLPGNLDPRDRRGRRNAIWLALLLVVAGFFVMIKGLYPGGGHDYYTHYFYYYMSVIRHGSILPNEVWYQFFYSKGAGLYFLAILLTDPLAPQLVAAAFIGAGALTVAALLNRTAPRSLFPWIGAILYIAFMIYTPGPPENMRQGGWGDLEKIHEINAVTVLGLFWIASRLGSQDSLQRRLWLSGLSATVITSVLLTAVMAVIVGAFMAVLTAYGVVTRNRRLAGDALCGGALTVLVLAAILAVNYTLTGIPLDQGLLSLWPIVDLEKVARWGVLSETLWLHLGLTGLLDRQVPPNVDLARLLFQFLRLDIWWPLAMIAIIAGWWRWFAGRWPALLGSADYRASLRTAVLFALGFTLVAVGVADSREQATSFYRFSSINYGPTLCALLLLCMALPDRPRLRMAISGAAVAAVTTIVVLASGPDGERIFGMTPRVFDSIPNYVPRIASSVRAVAVHAAYFLRGRFSIETAYRAQQPWPGRLPWGGIYPAMETVWRMVGHGTPIYSLHRHGYCMLPDCRVLTWMSTRAVPDTEVALFGRPDQAVAAFKRAGINYFFYSRELGAPGLGISTPLVLSPVLAPDTITEHLGIKWTDGISYLLTWREDSEQPLGEEFVATYRGQIRQSAAVASFPLRDWKAVYEHFQDKGLRPFRLPWCLTCGAMPND
jgi:hypothetical protein